MDDWIFDLDNTLYRAECGLFGQIDRRMTAFISIHLSLPAEDARRLQKRLFREHGTTLRGLMRRHDVDPTTFLDFVHDIDISVLAPDPALDEALGLLPGRKFVFTNGTAAHGERVLARLGVARHFDALFDIIDSGYVPKPEPAAYQRLLTRHAVVPRRAAMIEDLVANLEPAAALGMETVWLRGTHQEGPSAAGVDHVDHIIDDLPAWLRGAAREKRPGAIG